VCVCVCVARQPLFPNVRISAGPEGILHSGVYRAEDLGARATKDRFGIFPTIAGPAP
jgi:hypothetical protein